jgi:hypothetical protein
MVCKEDTFWVACTRAFEALAQRRMTEARQLLVEAEAEIHCEDQTLLRGRQRVLARYRALLALREVEVNKCLSGNGSPMPSTFVARVSLVTSVFNRLWQLQQTLPANLQAIRAEPDIEIVLVDFGGQDSQEIQNFVQREFAIDLLSGKLKYFVANVPWTKFHMATAKNVVHRLSTGDFIFSLDADNYFRQEDLEAVRLHLRLTPAAILHQTTGSAPMRYSMWSKYELFQSRDSLHDVNPSWDGSCGRIGVTREAFERINGYNENFVGMGMDDIDFLIRAIRTGCEYKHVGLVRANSDVFIDNGSADVSHQHENNQQNWKLMDECIASASFVPVYETDSPLSRFSRFVPEMVCRTANARVTLFASLFSIEPYVNRFLHDLQGIARTPGVCIWLMDVVGSHAAHVSEALQAASDGQSVFYAPVRHDPGLYALWNLAIKSIQSPCIGNLNADDLRGPGWLSACLDPLEAGLTDISSPYTVPFEDVDAIDHGAALAALRAADKRETRWFDSRVVVEGSYPDERARHEPLTDGEYSENDLFQVLPDGTLASYCIPNASAVWNRRIHEIVGYFDEPEYGSVADLALWAEAGSRGFRFHQVRYPALFFISPRQAHRRQVRSDYKLLRLAFRHGAPSLREFASHRQFDLSRIGGSYGDHHFMGWNWVRDEIAAQFQHTSSRLLLDLFVERSFFWNPNPGENCFHFTQPWLGFIHTTPHDSPAFDHKGQNLDALIAEPRFQSSLQHCRGLIVLSETNQQHLRKRLLYTHSSIPIYRLFHPNIPLTEPSETCTVDLGDSTAHKVFHVGWHLRSFSAFARLRVDRSRKVLLVPKKLPLDYFLREVVDRELRLSDMGCAEDHFGEIYSASQSDYAHILRRGILFNHYLEPSGSNFISECISAGSRLIVNRHPAFEEYLGVDYPLFYDSDEEANSKIKLADSASTGRQVHQQLAWMQETWSIRRFCKDLSRIGEDIYARS